MNREEAIKILDEQHLTWTIKKAEEYCMEVNEAIDMAIEALKAQDRPIICPRCGRTFAESEGREKDK